MSKTATDLAELITAYYPKLRKFFRNLVSIREIPISMTQLTCLTVLDKQDEMTMSALAKELSMSNQQLTKVIDALEAFEMAERVFDPTNRRQILAKITPKGKQTVSALRNELDRKLSRVTQKISPDEMDKLYESFAHIASYLGFKDE